MKSDCATLALLCSAIIGCFILDALGQSPGAFPTDDHPGFEGPPPFGPGGPGPDGLGPGGPGPGGFGGVREKTKLVQQFDKDGDGHLNLAERKAAREFLNKERAEGRGPRRFGPRGHFGGRDDNQDPPQPGRKLSPADVKSFPDAPLYDPLALRTFFLEFEESDWEKALAEFKGTDVEVPAKLTVDGHTYQDVGVHMRGASSFMMVREGRKRSLNLSLDFVHGDQRLYGYRTLNLLNSHEDPTFLRSILSYQIAREYIPAPKANLARVVINGESWGIYVNVQQFNKDFINEWFGTGKGARWKTPGSPRGQASLAYLGEDAAPYKRIYEIKSKDELKHWADLIQLCKTLNETKPDQLEAALSPILDIDGALKFLALQNVLINNDGYWIRASDYSIYEDKGGRFHIFPQDSNETFLRPESPGNPGGPRGFGPGGPRSSRGPRVEGVKLDPLTGATDSTKPLLSNLLAVPKLRSRYLTYVRDIAGKWLDWKILGPIAEKYSALIADDVKADTRKLYGTDDFERGLREDTPGRGFGPGGGGTISLKHFADQRRAYLSNYQETLKAAN